MVSLILDSLAFVTFIRRLLNFDSKLTQRQCEFYVDQFKKEILDQDLRESIKRETEPVRNLVLAQAFSKTNLIKDE